MALLVGIFPVAASAAQDSVSGSGVRTSVSGANSVGNLIARELEENSSDESSSSSLQDVTVENGVATVRFCAAERAQLVVAVYEEETGRPGTWLDPQGSATRAQVATILMRFVKNILR